MDLPPDFQLQSILARFESMKLLADRHRKDKKVLESLERFAKKKEIKEENKKEGEE